MKGRSGISRRSSIAVLLSLVMLMAVGEINARKIRYKAPYPKERNAAETRAESNVEAAADSVYIVAMADSIILSGYDKTLGSAKESFFIVNRSSRPIESVDVELTYTDVATRQIIHRRRVTIEEAVPPGEGRRVDVPSFDTQRTFYYVHGKRPRKGGKPFSVSLRLAGLTLKGL